MVAAVKRKRRRMAAATKAAGRGNGSTTTGSGSTNLTVLLESWSDVDDHAESVDDMRVNEHCCWSRIYGG